MTEFENLAGEASQCTKCALSKARTHVVFGVGNPEAELLFVGEAPGRNEDLEGEPFVGRAGQLLNTMLDEIGIQRSDTYIANILKCRPPGNRDPVPAEVETCTSYLDRQIDLIRPSVVVTLGNFATKYLLATNVGITRLRGRRFKFRDTSALIPTFHPAAVLRGGGTKLDDMRADFATIRRSIDTARSYGQPHDTPSEQTPAPPAPSAVGITTVAPSDDQLELF